MARSPFLIKLTQIERDKLNEFKQTALEQGGVRSLRRVQAILLSQNGWSVKRISEHFEVHPRTIWKWFKIYQKKGLQGLKGTHFSHKL